MIKYDQKEGGEVEISLKIKDHNLIISITDFDGPKFDMVIEDLSMERPRNWIFRS